MKYEYHFEVRGYELDSFGHVNNAVYLNYYEQARWLIMKELGLLDYFKNTEGFLVVIKAELKFVKELQLLEKAVVNTTYTTEGFFVIFKQEIRNMNNEKVNSAIVKCILVDKSRQPADIPDEILKGIANDKS